MGSGCDGRQTCGVEVVMVVLMVFQEGEGWCESSSSHFCPFNDSTA